MATSSWHYIFILCPIFIACEGFKLSKSENEYFKDTITFNESDVQFSLHEWIDGDYNTKYFHVENETNGSGLNAVSSVCITACIYNTSTLTIENVLANITEDDVNRAAEKGPIFLEDVVKENLKMFDGFYIYLYQILTKPGAYPIFEKDKGSKVVQKSWNISTSHTTGVWHVFVYPSMAPEDVCLKQIDSASKVSKDVTDYNLIIGLPIGILGVLILAVLAVLAAVICWRKFRHRQFNVNLERDENELEPLDASRLSDTSVLSEQANGNGQLYQP